MSIFQSLSVSLRIPRESEPMTIAEEIGVNVARSSGPDVTTSVDSP